jgi:hypothetical protein
MSLHHLKTLALQQSRNPCHIRLAWPEALPELFRCDPLMVLRRANSLLGLQ